MSGAHEMLCVCVWCHRLLLYDNPELEELPIGLWRLTSLKTLWLSGCPKLRIPEHLKKDFGRSAGWLGQRVPAESSELRAVLELSRVRECWLDRVAVRVVGTAVRCGQQVRIGRMHSWELIEMMMESADACLSISQSGQPVH